MDVYQASARPNETGRAMVYFLGMGLYNDRYLFPSYMDYHCIDYLDRDCFVRRGVYPKKPSFLTTRNILFQLFTFYAAAINLEKEV